MYPHFYKWLNWGAEKLSTLTKVNRCLMEPGLDTACLILYDAFTQLKRTSMFQSILWHFPTVCYWPSHLYQFFLN